MSHPMYQRIGRRNVEVTSIRRAVKKATDVAKTKQRVFSVLFHSLEGCDLMLMELRHEREQREIALQAEELAKAAVWHAEPLPF